MSRSPNQILVGCCCLVLAACGGNIGESDSDGPIGSTEGRIQMDLTGSQLASSQQIVAGNPSGNGKMDQVAQINVTISKVTAHSASQGWVELFNGTPITIDLLDLKNSTTSLGFKNLPAGKITQIRLYTTEGATQNVVLKSGSTVDLKVPSGLQSGIKVKGLFDLKACTKTTLAFGFVGHKSIWVHPTGQGDLWILRPVIHASTVDGQQLPCNSGSGGGNGGTGGGTGKDPNQPIGSGGGSGSIPLIENGGPCVSGNQCLGGACIQGVCSGNGGTTTPGTTPNGGTCSAPSQCVGGVCLNGVCSGGNGGTTGTTPNGGACTSPSQCVGGACLNGVCGSGGSTNPGTPTLTETGGPCAMSSQCLSGACLNGVCQPGGSGSACTSNTGCISQLCQAGTCAPPSGAGGTGSVCSANTGCLSGSCINGVCDPGATGQPCRASTDCTSGLSCVAGSCVVPIN
jgi:Domain of unknown function (DUF4382)